MSTTWGSADAKCPFYLSDHAQKISCEGAFDGSVLSSIYKRSMDKNGVKERYCDQRYEDCTIYQMLMRKYEENK